MGFDGEQGEDGIGLRASAANELEVRDAREVELEEARKRGEQCLYMSGKEEQEQEQEGGQKSHEDEKLCVYMFVSILFATVSKRLHSCSLLPGMQQVAQGEKVNSHDGG